MIKNAAIGLIRIYQKYLSPLTPPSCRYRPTCSNYAIEAISRFGLLNGGLMALARILRCHPFARGGLDLVPDNFSLKRNEEKH